MCPQGGSAVTPPGLMRIAEVTGVNIIAGCGYYKAAGHPPNMSERTVNDVAAELVHGSWRWVSAKLAFVPAL